MQYLFQVFANACSLYILSFSSRIIGNVYQYKKTSMKSPIEVHLHLAIDMHTSLCYRPKCIDSQLYQSLQFSVVSKTRVAYFYLFIAHSTNTHCLEGEDRSYFLFLSKTWKVFRQKITLVNNTRDSDTTRAWLILRIQNCF